MTKKYLHDCLEQFPDISKQRWERPFNMKALEDEVKKLDLKKLNVGKLQQCFKNTKHWWFDTYWLLPSIADLPENMEEISFNFHQLSKGNEGKPRERQVIKDLLGAFRQIELVSIILRFIRPDSFGILSPPVEHVLDLRRGRDAVETYKNYLKNLRDIRDHYEFNTAAEADMALWVLEHKCYFSGMEDQEIKRAFETDEFMLQLRAENLVKPLCELSPAWRAMAFQNIDDHLAALMGCYALEENVKKWAIVEGVAEEAARLAKEEAKKSGYNKPKQPTLHHYIEALASKKKISSLEHGNLKLMKKIRDKVFHAEVREPTKNEVKMLIETVLKIEQRLSNRKLEEEERDSSNYLI